MAVKFGFVLALVAVSLCLLATQSAAAPSSDAAISVLEPLNQLVEETAGPVENPAQELETVRVRRSPQVCRHVIVRNKKNGKNYPHWQCN